MRIRTDPQHFEDPNSPLHRKTSFWIDIKDSPKEICYYKRCYLPCLMHKSLFLSSSRNSDPDPLKMDSRVRIRIKMLYLWNPFPCCKNGTQFSSQSMLTPPAALIAVLQRYSRREFFLLDIYPITGQFFAPI